MTGTVTETSSTQQIHLNKIVRYFRVLLKLALTVVFLAFVRDLVAQLHFPTIEDLNGRVILKVTLVGCLYCWYWGCNNDLSVENDILRRDPGWQFMDTLVALAIAVGFAFLFLVNDMRTLSVTFILFLAANVLGWLYIRRRLEPLVAETERLYDSGNDALGLVKTAVFRDYMFGRWQWYRFSLGLSLLILLAGIAFGPLTRVIGVPQDLLFAVWAAVALSALEVWIWHRRIVLKTLWDGMDWLGEHGYLLSRSVPN